MQKTLSLLAAIAITILGANLSQAAENDASAEARHAIPKEFIAVDTSRVLGSPDPLPLEPVKAFPQLKFERPTELTHAGDGTNRLFVVEQQGVIRVFKNDRAVKESRPFLDIREVVLREGNEEGLLGLAFHPDFKANGEFFVYYSAKPRASVISRFKVSKDNPNKADRESEEPILRIEQPYPNHNGGSIKFGPDGFLYIGLGDGGLRDDPHSHGQNLETLLGSILRIDVDRQDEGLAYAIPQDNPFVGRGDARGEIWAYGFRNVWRLGFDSETGELWAGDVGQDRFEEVNRVERGGNYGWNIREGMHDFEPRTAEKPTSLIDPLAEYFRGDGQSVTGGTVYRGSRLKGFAGAYFYADYLSGNVWALRLKDGKVHENRQVARTGLMIAAFGEDEQREMYLCGFDGFIYRLANRKLDLAAMAKAFPRKLSETGLFASVPDNEPAPGLIPYEVNVPFWSDYAVKDRYIALPEKGKVTFSEQEKWQFPVGTVFVKTFWMHRDRVHLSDPRRLETRLFVHAPEGWTGYTYVYSDDGSEAHLLDGWLTRPVQVKTEAGAIDQPYYFPARNDCLTCHTKQEGFVLGLTTRQMNREMQYRGQSENQIEMLTRLEVFAAKPEKPPAELEKFLDWGFGNFERSESKMPAAKIEAPQGDTTVLARSWLEVNCAMCHRPEGIAPLKRDMRFHIPLEKMNLVSQPPGQGQMGPQGTMVIAPGQPYLSELLLRSDHRGARQMPPLATQVIDPHGHEVLLRWIEQLPPAPPAP